LYRGLPGQKGGEAPQFKGDEPHMPWLASWAIGQQKEFSTAALWSAKGSSAKTKPKISKYYRYAIPKLNINIRTMPMQTRTFPRRDPIEKHRRRRSSPGSSNKYTHKQNSHKYTKNNNDVNLLKISDR
jgi:hypothetical protein